MLQSGGLAARPDGSTSVSDTWGGSEITRAHPAAAIVSPIMMIAVRTNNEVSTQGRCGQERLRGLPILALGVQSYKIATALASAEPGA
jgi:hypothetical protein